MEKGEGEGECFPPFPSFLRNVEFGFSRIRFKIFLSPRNGYRFRRLWKGKGGLKSLSILSRKNKIGREENWKIVGSINDNNAFAERTR